MVAVRKDRHRADTCASLAAAAHFAPSGGTVPGTAGRTRSFPAAPLHSSFSDSASIAFRRPERRETVSDSGGDPEAARLRPAQTGISRDTDSIDRCGIWLARPSPPLPKLSASLWGQCWYDTLNAGLRGLLDRST